MGFCDVTDIYPKNPTSIIIFWNQLKDNVDKDIQTKYYTKFKENNNDLDNNNKKKSKSTRLR